jgi:hypothetical protein
MQPSSSESGSRTLADAGANQNGKYVYEHWVNIQRVLIRLAATPSHVGNTSATATWWVSLTYPNRNRDVLVQIQRTLLLLAVGLS